MAQPRSQHYWRQLRCALTAGQWDANAPAKDWHQRPCSWSELIRKFLKHSPEHRDVAELASQTQALCLLLSANATSLDGGDVGPQGSLALGEESVLPEERIEEATVGYDSLKQLDASRSDVREAVSQIQTLFLTCAARSRQKLRWHSMPSLCAGRPSALSTYRKSRIWPASKAFKVSSLPLQLERLAQLRR